MTAAANVAFVEQVRARRSAAGRPDRIEAESLYRILDGLLARGTIPTEAGTAQSSYPEHHHDHQQRRP